MRKQREDLTGQRFGMLTVIGRNPEDYVYKCNGRKEPRWDCICDCQKDNPNPEITTVMHHNLKNGHCWNCGRHNKNKFKDETGNRYGKLVVIMRAPDRIDAKGEKHTRFICKCDCGNYTEEDGHTLRIGHAKSCGCLKVEASTIHGGKGSRLYGVWCGIKRRCYNPNLPSFKYYGARGIGICDEWKDDFAAFRDWAFSHGYDENAEKFECTIDRINVNKGYSPDNCRFVSMKVQANNRTNTVKIDSGHGEMVTVNDISEATGIANYTIRSRIDSGWTYDQIINTPVANIYSYGMASGTRSDFDAVLGFEDGTIAKRMRHGMNFEEAIQTPVANNATSAVFFVDPKTRKPINQFSNLIDTPQYQEDLKTFGELIMNKSDSKI